MNKKKKEVNLMDLIKTILGQTQNQQLISPVPEAYNLSNPGLLNYYQANQANEDIAHQKQSSPTPTPTPMDVTYPQWMANAPSANILPGQTEWVNIQMEKSGNNNREYWNNLYRQATSAPGGNFYQPTPTPVFSQIIAQQPNFVQSALQKVGQVVGMSQSTSSWNELVNEANKVSQQTGIPLQVILGQAYAETSGKPENAPGHNWFGMKGTGTAGTQSQKTWEDYGKGRQDVNANFGAYKNVSDAVNAYANWIKSRPEVYKLKDNPIAMVSAIKKAGYATDPKYVYNVINNPAWKQYSQPLPKPSPTLPPRQNVAFNIPSNMISPKLYGGGQ